MRELIAHAASLGVSVSLAPIDDDPSLLGYYSSMYRRVVARIGMPRGQTRWVIGHELGHAYYDHACAGVYADTLNERQADRYAATLLIDPDEYARLEALNPDQHWLAEEFDVSVDAIFAYERHCLTKLRGVTYTHARHGIGQWALRHVLALGA